MADDEAGRDALDDAVVALVRRMGRRGANEAAVWTILRADVPGVTPAECAQAIGRLIGSGHLYREQRRTRTMLRVSWKP
jgi:hypothetical protein